MCRTSCWLSFGRLCRRVLEQIYAILYNMSRPNMVMGYMRYDDIGHVYSGGLCHIASYRIGGSVLHVVGAAGRGPYRIGGAVAMTMTWPDMS